MQNYRVIEMLKTFGKEDIKRFSEFLRSPFFNKSQKLVKFYESLITFHPGFSSKFLNEKRLLRKTSPGLPFNKSTALNLFSDLAEAVEKYFVQLCLHRRDAESGDFLRDELFKRDLGRSVAINIARSRKSSGERKSFNADYFLNNYRLVNDMINYQVLNRSRSKGAAIKELDLMHSERGRYITYFFVREMIVGFDNLLTLNKTFMLDTHNNFVFRIFREVEFDKLLEVLINDSVNNEDAKIFRIYQAFFFAFSNFQNEKYYYEYKKLLLNNLEFLSPDEIRSHGIRLIRYCMLKAADKYTADKFNKELFEVYEFILSNGYYKSSLSEYMPVELYRTMLLLSLKLNKHKWAFEFIKKYKSKLAPDKRVNMYHYSCAEYYFSRGRYEEAMKNFHKVRLDHFMMKLDVKHLMLMTYYELGLFENALSCLDAYRHFLSNDKTLSNEMKKKNRSFINVVNLMISYKSTWKNSLKFKIENELKNNFPYKDWVEEKISQLDVKYDKSA